MWRFGGLWLLWLGLEDFFGAEGFFGKTELPYAQQGGAVIID